MHAKTRRLEHTILVVILACVGEWTACTGGVNPKPAAALPAVPAVPTVAVTGEKNKRVEHTLDLLASLWAYDRKGRNREAQQISFEIPEGEINDYLAYSLRVVRRPGIERVAIKLLPHNEVRATAVIDFDAVGRWNPGTVPLRLQAALSGKHAIYLEAQFEAHDGILNFTLKAAQDREHKLIPKNVAESILRSLGAQQPEQYDTSGPIQLPMGLQRVWTESELLCGNT
jgi:hypothetical protein